MTRVLVSAGVFLALVSGVPASADSFGARAFDGDDWVDGLVDLRPSDIRNTALVSSGMTDSGLLVTIPEGTFRGLGPFDRLPASTEQAWYRYHIKLLDFDARSSGKLPGLSGIYSGTGRGCKPSRPGSPGWSARGLFGPEGSNGAPDGEIPIGVYLYHLYQPDLCGEAIYWEDSSLRPGKWHCIEGYVKLNSLGNRDGVVKGWLDGTEKFSKQRLAFRRPDEAGVSIREMWLDIFYGGKKPTDNQLNLMIDEVSVSTSGRVGCLDRSTEVVGSFDRSVDEIATYAPETGDWSLNRPNGESFSPESLMTYSPADDWSDHLVGDYNGDGKDDIASYHPSDGSWWVLGSSESGFTTANWATFSLSTGWGNHLSGDFNGDGRDDVASYQLSDGTWWVSQSTPLTDPSEDIAQIDWLSDAPKHASGRTSPSDRIVRELSMYFGLANNSFATSMWDTFASARGWSDQLVGDFNGDGKDDIASYYPGSGSWWVSLSDGDSFTTASWTDFDLKTGWKNQVVGDFNGDGMDDVAGYHGKTDTWWVSLSEGDGFATTLWDTFTPTTGWTSQIAGDFNGDGMDDVANFHSGNGTWWVSLSRGNGFATTLWDTFTPSSGWTSQIAGDFNGDGKTDIANFHLNSSTWWVSLSDGSQFATTHWAG